MLRPEWAHLDNVAVEKLNAIIFGKDARAAQLFIFVRGELVSWKLESHPILDLSVST
jgi:hypothetical protein